MEDNNFLPPSVSVFLYHGVRAGWISVKRAAWRVVRDWLFRSIWSNIKWFVWELGDGEGVRKSFGWYVSEVTHNSVIFRHLQRYMIGFVCEQKSKMFTEHSHDLSIASKNARSPTGSQHEKGGGGEVALCRISPAPSPAAPALPVSFLGDRQV